MSISTIEEKIAAISEQHRKDNWAARQQAAKKQEQDAEINRVERYRTQRIAQLQAELNGLPARRKAFETRDVEAAELAAMFAGQIDKMANDYAQRIHAERQKGRAIRLELASNDSQAYFHGAEIKKGLRQLSLIANSRTLGAPLLDAEAFLSELKEDERRIKAELDELQMK